MSQVLLRSVRATYQIRTVTRHYYRHIYTMAESSPQPDNAPIDGLQRSKKLIVCCDGTWKNSASSILTSSSLLPGWSFFFPTKNPVEQTPTNVTRISRAITPVDSHQRPQIVYYQAGVGTEGGILSRAIAGAIGQGLAENVREAYSFIAINYVEGDEIFLIGFSRGAYTARSVAGLIGDFGLLTRDGLDHFLDIFNDWESSGRANYRSALMQDDASFSIQAGVTDIKAWTSAYKTELRRIGYAVQKDVPIQAVGVWETVGALGIPLNPILQRLGLPWHIRPYRFFDTALSSSIKHAYQALALDEHRAAYYPAIWEKPSELSTTLKQTWFPGVHSGVGGGYADSGLSTITLAWMMSQLSGFIDFDRTYLRKQFALEQKVLRAENAPASAFQWAASQLRNSARGLAVLLGSTTRTPGRYHRYDRKADRTSATQVLQNTHEHIHYAVRSRERTGGLDMRKKVVAYRPKAMTGYDLVDPTGETGQAVWRYSGKDKRFQGVELTEDELGVFERELLEYYREGHAVRK
nr:uncharacterized protein CFP56_19236 [Quercus suber]